MRMVRGYLRCRDLWEDGGTSDAHELLRIVERQDLGTNVLNAVVDHVESVFARVDVRDDPVVHIDESLLGVLDAKQHAIE